MHTIEDLLNEEVIGKVYEEQLQKVDLPVTFVIDKVQRRSTNQV